MTSLEAIKKSGANSPRSPLHANYIYNLLPINMIIACSISHILRCIHNVCAYDLKFQSAIFSTQEYTIKISFKNGAIVFLPACLYKSES